MLLCREVVPYNKYMSLGTEARCGARFFSDSDDDHDAIQVICGQDTAGAAQVSFDTILGLL